MPVLHIPDEPTAHAERWLAAVLDGQELRDVVAEQREGIAAWFWSRWRTLASAGLDEQQLASIVLGYRRELWLWLAGERTWGQCCSGLVGRINRRLAGGGAGMEG